MKKIIITAIVTLILVGLVETLMYLGLKNNSDTYNYDDSFEDNFEDTEEPKAENFDSDSYSQNDLQYILEDIENADDLKEFIMIDSFASTLVNILVEDEYVILRLNGGGMPDSGTFFVYKKNEYNNPYIGEELFSIRYDYRSYVCAEKTFYFTENGINYAMTPLMEGEIGRSQAIYDLMIIDNPTEEQINEEINNINQRILDNIGKTINDEKIISYDEMLIKILQIFKKNNIKDTKIIKYIFG